MISTLVCNMPSTEAINTFIARGAQGSRDTLEVEVVAVTRSTGNSLR